MNRDRHYIAITILGHVPVTASRRIENCPEVVSSMAQQGFTPLRCEAHEPRSDLRVGYQRGVGSEGIHFIISAGLLCLVGKRRGFRKATFLYFLPLFLHGTILISELDHTVRFRVTDEVLRPPSMSQKRHRTDGSYLKCARAHTYVRVSTHMGVLLVVWFAVLNS